MARAPTVVTWPGAPSTADPWEDRYWVTGRHAGVPADLEAAWDAYRMGALPRERYRAIAAAHGLTDPLHTCPNKPDWGAPVPSIDDLVRLAADHWPQVGIDAPDAVLGPASLFAHRSLLRAAVAGAAFLRTPEMPFSAFHIWATRKPLPPVALRASLRGPGLAPWSLWSVRKGPSGRVLLEDAVGLGRHYVPDGPVTPLGEGLLGEAIAARVLRGPEGWFATCVLALPSLPPRPVVRSWIEEVTWLARVHLPHLTTEQLLRERPVVVRRAFEHCVTAER